MGTTFGALAVLMPIYGYWQGLAILFGIILIPFIITRNVALSMGTGLVALPFIAWLGMQSGPFVIWQLGRLGLRQRLKRTLSLATGKRIKIKEKRHKWLYHFGSYNPYFVCKL